MNKTRNFSEFAHFDKLANEWWLEDGKYKILHKITPIRIKYILDHIKSKNIRNLQITLNINYHIYYLLIKKLYSGKLDHSF